MTKKILLLVLFLPIICMLCLFTTTKTVSLAIDVPVSGIDILEDDIVYLSLDQNDRYKIDYTVYPTNAANKEVTLQTAKIDDNRLASFDFVDGYLIPKTVGMARVFLMTNDGGFKDSFIVKVDSTVVQGLESEISKNEILIGEKAYIATKFIPANALDQLIAYSSSNPEVATVNAKGEVSGVGSGSAVITIYSVNRPHISTTVEINVYSAGDLDIPTPEVVSLNKEGSVDVIVSCETEYSLSYRVLDSALNPSTENVEVTFGQASNGRIAINYKFNNNFIGTVNLEVTLTTILGAVTTKTIKIRIIDEVTVSFDHSIIPTFTVGGSGPLFYTVDGDDVTITKYEVSSDNENITVNMFGEQIVLIANKVGLATVTLKVSVAELANPITTTLVVLVSPKNFNVIEKITNGIEGVWTIGGSDNKEFKLDLSHDKNVSADFNDFIHWEAVDKQGNVLNNVLSFQKDGTFKVIDQNYHGDIYIRCVFEYEDYRLESNKALVRIVKDGVNITTYRELIEATEAEKAVVLHASIEEDFGFINGNVKYYEIPTTYDWTYYKNNGHTTAPKVKVLVQFKNDLYGNGYMINAHNLTYGLDSYGQLREEAIFRGPLDFVGLVTNGDGAGNNSGAVSVKGQDNIIFALYEGVSVFDVELKGCNLQADQQGNFDLTDLDYVGTTVEVLGNNVEINHSRITNGRMTLRIFGDANDANKVINVNINNSIISGAREFLIRMGSNAFVDGYYKEDGTMVYAPYLPNNTSLKINKFPMAASYVQMSKANQQIYDDNFIKTFVTIKNSVFEDCGIFSIGLDSHFAGEALFDGSLLSISSLREWLKDWKGLAKTSYGAKLSFEGDVRIFDWKTLDSIDSSSLIEIIGDNKTFKKLSFNVSQLVETLIENPKFASIVYKENEVNYVHGGIVVFGGGKNYCVFEDNNTFAKMNTYQVSLADVGESYLEVASGHESFYFKMCGSDSTFTPATQRQYFSSGNAYENVYANKN